MPSAADFNLDVEVGFAGETFEAAAAVAAKGLGLLQHLGGDRLEQLEFGVGLGQRRPQRRGDQIPLAAVAVRHGHGGPVLVRPRIDPQQQRFHRLAQLLRRRGRRIRARDRLGAAERRIDLVGKHFFEQIHRRGSAGLDNS